MAAGKKDRNKANGCFLSVFLTIFLCYSTNIAAQEGIDTLSGKTHQLGDVLIISKQSPVENMRTARVITFLTRDKIEISPAIDAARLLRSMAGTDIRERGPAGAQADIGIRGGTFDQTLILLNGVNITDPQTGHNNLTLPVDPGAIERIEILQGPSSKIFGANAFSGAVNVITGNGTENVIKASLKAGQFGLNSQSVNASVTSGSLSQFLSMHRLSYDGYISNTDLSTAGFYYQASHNSKRVSTELQTGYTMKQFGANSFYSLRYPEQFESVKSGIASIKFQTNGKIRASQTLYLRHNLDRFELKRNDDSVPFNHHRTLTSGGNLTITTGGTKSRSTISIDLRNETILSSILGTPTNHVAVKGFEGSFYTRHNSRLNTSVFGGQNLSFGNFSADAGILLFHSNGLEGMRLYPGLDMSYRVTNGLKLYAAVNRSFRLPTFTDLFYKSPVQKGNSKLKPEEAWTTEGGIKLSSSPFSGSFTIFRRNGNNLIDWVKFPSPDSTIWRSQNHLEMRFNGIESSVSYIPETSPGNGILKSVTLSLSFLSADTTGQILLSKYTLDYLSGKASASATFSISQKISFSAGLTWYNRNGEWQDAGGVVTSYKPYCLLDAKIMWTGKWLTIYTSGTNILNSSYYDFGGLIQPGIWLTTGLEVDFDIIKNKKGTGSR